MTLARLATALLTAGVPAGASGCATATPMPPAAVTATPPANFVSPTETPPAATYRLRPGDVIQVRVYEHPELAELLPIRPDGRISLQLVGEAAAAGRSVEELSSHLTEQYGRTFRSPSVAVIVKEFARNRVFVGGEVNAPGVIETGTPLTALQALMQSGGAKDTAELSNVVLIRYQGSTEPHYASLDLRSDLRAAATPAPAGPNDILLQPYDILYVPKTRIATMNQFVREHITQLLPATLTLGVTYFFGAVVR